MNNPAPFPPLTTLDKPDEISTFLGDVAPDEFELRAKMRSYRNAATAMISKTESDTARKLAWETIEWLTPNLYSAAPLEWLDQLNLLASRLLKTAMTAEDLDRILKDGSGHE